MELGKLISEGHLNIWNETETRIDFFAHDPAVLNELVNLYPDIHFEMFQEFEQRSNHIRFKLEKSIHVHFYADTLDKSNTYRSIIDGVLMDPITLNNAIKTSKTHRLKVRAYRSLPKCWEKMVIEQIQVFPPVCHNILENPKVVGTLLGRFHIMEFVLYCDTTKNFSIVPIVSARIEGKDVLVECGRKLTILDEGNYEPIEFSENYTKNKTKESIAEYLGVDIDLITQLRST